MDFGSYAFDPSAGTGGFDWDNLINRGFTLAGDIWGQSSHPFADDPRYQQPTYQQPIYTTQGGQVIATANQGGAGIHLSTNTLMLIAGGILIFMVARRR
jgi:hypothetical protein